MEECQSTPFKEIKMGAEATGTEKGVVHCKCVEFRTMAGTGYPLPPNLHADPRATEAAATPVVLEVPALVVAPKKPCPTIVTKVPPTEAGAKSGERD